MHLYTSNAFILFSFIAVFQWKIKMEKNCIFNCLLTHWKRHQICVNMLSFQVNLQSFFTLRYIKRLRTLSTSSDVHGADIEKTRHKLASKWIGCWCVYVKVQYNTIQYTSVHTHAYMPQIDDIRLTYRFIHHQLVLLEHVMLQSTPVGLLMAVIRILNVLRSRAPVWGPAFWFHPTKPLNNVTLRLFQSAHTPTSWCNWYTD